LQGILGWGAGAHALHGLTTEKSYFSAFPYAIKKMREAEMVDQFKTKIQTAAAFWRC
jgi:hypothetical protein